jgi:hypothetical protein
MAQPFIRVPLRRLARHGFDIFRIDLDLDVRENTGRYCRLPFRIDSASDFTTIPISTATSLGIQFATDRPVYPHTAAGKARRPSYLTAIEFSFPGLPHFLFDGVAMFSPYELKTLLLAVGDLIPNFLIRFPVAATGMPDGCVILQLRRDHRGHVR